MEKTIKKVTCLRCRYSWYPYKPEPPKVCASLLCKSPYWNKPRQQKKKS